MELRFRVFASVDKGFEETVKWPWRMQSRLAQSQPIANRDAMRHEAQTRVQCLVNHIIPHSQYQVRLVGDVYGDRRLIESNVHPALTD
jgi:hypothetical protein